MKKIVFILLACIIIFLGCKPKKKIMKVINYLLLAFGLLATMLLFSCKSKYYASAETTYLGKNGREIIQVKSTGFSNKKRNVFTKKKRMINAMKNAERRAFEVILFQGLE